MPAAFHPDRYGTSRVRFVPGPDVCSHFAVNVGSFEDAVAWARGQADLIADDVPFEAWRARAAYYFDPAGNLVELIARERAPGTDLLMEVSEIGLPVADVGAAVDFLETELGLPHFSGDRTTLQRGRRRPRAVHRGAGRPRLAVHRQARHRRAGARDDRGPPRRASCASPGPSTS